MDNNGQPPSNTPDAPDKEKMDQIRRRRLEKLGGPTNPKPQSTPTNEEGLLGSSSTPSKVEPAVVTPVPPKAPTTAPSTASEIPASKQSSGISTPATTSQGTTTPTVRNPDTTLKRRRTESSEQNAPRAAPRKAAIVPETETLEIYENKTLSSIFRITLDPKQRVDSANHKLIHLPNLQQELEDEGLPVMLTKDRLDSAIMEAATSIPHNKSVLDYLLPCWKRVNKAIKGLRGYATAKDVILKEAKRLCMSNMIFAAEVPELFGREPNASTDSLAPHLLFEAGEDGGICPDFLNEVVSRWDEDETVRPMITKAIATLSMQLSKMSMKDNYKPYMNALKILCSFAPIVTAISQDPLFQMAVSAPNIEKMTILGPFFRISPLQAEVTSEYFAAPNSMDKRQIHTAQEALRLTLQAHQRDLLDVVNHFVRASPASKEKTLDWFAHIVNSNHKRRAMRPDAAELSTDGFLMNVTVVLDGLCEPFMDTTFSKVDRINIDYLRQNPRVDIKDETKLNADQNASDSFYEQKIEGAKPNFISEIFFLTLAAHHYGSGATNSMLTQLDKDIKYLKEKLVSFEAERHKFANHPANLARFEEQVRRYTEVLTKSLSLKYATEGVLFDKTMQAKSLMFMRVVTVWLLRVATNTPYTPDKSITLPLPSEQPEAFKCLPEYVLEDIVGNFNFVFRFIPDVMISAIGDEAIALCITFLTNSEYIKNPYLKAKLVTLLFHGTWPIYHRTKGVLGDSLSGSKFSNDHLLHALIKFYIEVESTGAHTQFYDKFNIRYEIFQVIKCIWTNDIYQQRLTQESKTNTQFFLRFVNLLLNDATYVLDEALTKFPKIHDLQAELRHGAADLTPEERTTKEEELATAEHQAQSYMQLTNETVSMMKLFTKSLSGSFTMREIVDRVAAMVGYILETLVGPKSTNLKVEDPKKYQFDPKTLLSEFVDIYINLGVSEDFVRAVARDGRSYKPENFDKATRILSRFGLKAPDDLAQFEDLKKRIIAAKERDDQEEVDLGEIPDEFMDPLLCDIMMDPVILPSSKAVLDRSTIKSHLLSDPNDPFNRQPLKIEDVIPDVELKAKIDAWREEKKAEARKAKADKMDTTEG